MIDLHCHLLPAIDDGANDLEQALQMARMSVDDGITHAVMTPHIQPGRWNNNKARIRDAVENYRQALKDQDIALEISFAAEVRLTDDIFTLLAAGDIPFLGELDGKKVMLIEFPPTHLVPGTDKLFAWLLARDILPMIAHPERNREIYLNPEKLKPFIDQGCLAQLTASSILGRFGRDVTAAAETFITRGWIHVVASDAHNTTTRKPQMSPAREKVAQLVDQPTVEKLFHHTPQQIIAA